LISIAAEALYFLIWRYPRFVTNCHTSFSFKLLAECPGSTPTDVPIAARHPGIALSGIEWGAASEKG